MWTPTFEKESQNPVRRTVNRRAPKGGAAGHRFTTFRGKHRITCALRKITVRTVIHFAPILSINRRESSLIAHWTLFLGVVPLFLSWFQFRSHCLYGGGAKCPADRLLYSIILKLSWWTAQLTVLKCMHAHIQFHPRFFFLFFFFAFSHPMYGRLCRNGVY